MTILHSCAHGGCKIDACHASTGVSLFLVYVQDTSSRQLHHDKGFQLDTACHGLQTAMHCMQSTQPDRRGLHLCHNHPMIKAAQCLHGSSDHLESYREEDKAQLMLVL
jgi:hypothetical protein